MADHVSEYLDRLAVRNVSPATIRSYGQDLRHAEAFVKGPLVKATEADMERYMASLHRAGLKATTIRRRQSSLRQFFDYCRRRKLIKSKPSDCFETPKVEERLPVHMASGQVSRLKASLAGETFTQLRDAAIVLTLYMTGMRAGELVGLAVSDLDLDDHQLRVLGKGRRERQIPIPDQLTAVLVRWLEVHPTREGALFVSAKYPHAPLAYDGVRDVVGAAMERAGLSARRFTPHKLRHTCATRLLSAGEPIDRIQKLLGHRRIETTTIYAHTKLDDEARSAMDSAL